MGHPPAGNGVSGDFLRAVDVAASETAHESIAHRAVPAALVALPVDIRIWLREIAQWRSGLEESHRPEFPLRNSTTANLARLVRPSTAAMGAEKLNFPDVHD